jgi:hypothetical protein
MSWFFNSKEESQEEIEKKIKEYQYKLDKLINKGDENNQSQDADPQITIEIFGSEDENSKGFYINDYKINTNNLDDTFSPNDQVKYFFTNLVGAIENNNLSDDNPDKKDKKNFFHSYTETMKVEPSSKPEPEPAAAKPAAAAGAGGGKKKKGSRKRKSKSKHRKTKKH